jgi:hypothetical protein
MGGHVFSSSPRVHSYCWGENDLKKVKRQTAGEACPLSGEGGEKGGGTRSIVIEHLPSNKHGAVLHSYQLLCIRENEIVEFSSSHEVSKSTGAHRLMHVHRTQFVEHVPQAKRYLFI